LAVYSSPLTMSKSRRPVPEEATEESVLRVTSWQYE
jgi:hypothetical protein